MPADVVKERYGRLTALQERISHEENQRVVGRTVEVLVSAHEGRKDGNTRRVTGRAQDGRLVHLDVPEGSGEPRPGDAVEVGITRAAPFHLIADSADGAPLRIRRTRAGDAWERAQADSCGVPTPAAGTASSAGGAPRVSLGLPSLRVPETGTAGAAAGDGSEHPRHRA